MYSEEQSKSRHKKKSKSDRQTRKTDRRAQIINLSDKGAYAFHLLRLSGQLLQSPSRFFHLIVDKSAQLLLSMILNALTNAEVIKQPKSEKGTQQQAFFFSKSIRHEESFSSSCSLD